MAKQRIIRPAFWSDSYIENLDPLEKYLFLYLLTNEKSNLIGIYQLSKKRAMLETWLDIEVIEKIIRRFQEADKIHYVDGWVIIKNHIKNQTLNPKIMTGIRREFSELPPSVIDYIYSIHSLYIVYTTLTLTLTWTLTWTWTSTKETTPPQDLEDSQAGQEERSDPKPEEGEDNPPVPLAPPVVYEEVDAFIEAQSKFHQVAKMREVKGDEAYKATQYKEYEKLFRKGWTRENLKPLLERILADEFRHQQVMTIAKLNEKHKDWLRYVDVLFDKAKPKSWASPWKGWAKVAWGFNS